MTSARPLPRCSAGASRVIFLLTSGFMLGTLAAYDLFPTAPALTLFFLSMCTFSFVDLLIALIGWWRNR